MDAVEPVDLEPRTLLVELAGLFLSRYGHLAIDGQLSLQVPAGTASDNPDRFTMGCGSFNEGIERRHKTPEFVHLYPETLWLAPLIRDVERHSGEIACRARLMTMPPKKCLSYHKDGEKWRYHLVASTTTGALFIVENKVYNMPVTGGLYRLRTDLMHTALNACKNGDRTHLVICTVPKFKS